ncbi:PLD nuclease N-terminal domain-containing protein [Actinocorallia populi]|uniref:PLD nuclease N-terminal domain-containing protein n=1 Tax=Actinocorallia populi TaxID=2079200 RepID=UPI001E3A57F7|nr:PLD nuclease N-terminal domain-containing protein [Actinocorallia populi]
MPILFGGFSLLLVALWIYCIFDVVTTDAQDCRNLPKPLWLLIVLVLPDLGSIVWLIAGRPRVVALRDRPRPAAPTPPDDDEDFLRGLREKVEEQRRKAREQQDRADEQE